MVVSILALLAAILFSAYAQDRARARQSRCAGNLHQIAWAGMLYLADYYERFPTCYWIASPPFAIDPMTSLQPYLRNREVLYCPERQTRLRDCLDPSDGFRPYARCMGYGYNWGSGIGWGTAIRKGDGLVRPATWAGGAAIGVLLAEVAEPSRCFLFGDTNDYVFLTLLREAMPGGRKDGQPEATTNGLGRPYEPPRHGGGNQFAFADGHVQWLPLPGGRWIDGGPWVAPDMSMYSRSGRWEPDPVP
jgi:prepilin-type processing-associated H-X9-DG protein